MSNTESSAKSGIGKVQKHLKPSNFAVKRLLKEFNEVNCSPDLMANLVDDNIFDWHFTFQGPEETPFEGGIYHGRIIFPSEYPMAPPDFIFFTANGKFEVNTKICLSNTGYHPESWQPSWNCRTSLIGIKALFPLKSSGSVGSMNTNDECKSYLRDQSNNFICSECGHIRKIWDEAKVKNVSKDKISSSEDHAKQAENVQISPAPEIPSADIDKEYDQQKENPPLISKDTQINQNQPCDYSSLQENINPPPVIDQNSAPNEAQIVENIQNQAATPSVQVDPVVVANAALNRTTLLKWVLISGLLLTGIAVLVS